jgi:DNA repair exonuclease SbcCD ATPase subunit
VNLTHIKASPFAGIRDLAADLTAAKVNVFCGPCGSGKSSIRDAVRWGLTGLARELTEKNKAVLLAPKGKFPEVALVLDGVELHRTATQCSMTVKAMTERFGHPDMLGAVVDAFNFVSKTQEKRAELVRGISANPDKLSALAVTELTKLKLPPTDVQAIAALVATNLKKAEEYAVGKRQEAGRKLDAAPKNAPAKKVVLGEVEWDLETSTVKDIESRAAEVRRSKTLTDQERIKVAEELGRAKQAASPEERRKRIAEINAELAKLGNADDKMVKAAVKEEAELTKAREQALADYNKAKGAKESAAERLKAAEKLKGKCPLCGHKLSAEDMATLVGEIADEGNVAGENMALAKTRGDEVRPKLEAATARVREAKDASYKAEGLRVEAASLKQRESENQDGAVIEKLTAQLAKLDASIQEFDKRLDLGAELLRAKLAYDVADTAFKTREAIEAEWKAWDRAQKLLGTGGPIRKVASAGFDIDLVNKHVAALLPGGHVTEENWVLTYIDDELGPRSVEQCSRSEKFRLGCAFAAALSKAAGIGLLVLDEAEILVGPAQADFIGWLESIAGDFNRVLVCASRPVPPPPSAVPWMALWWVEGGTVRPLVAEAVTA